jgi:hypothetical protein
MSWDEYTYEVDMMLTAEFGEPATHEQLYDITAAYERGVPPNAAFAGIADSLYEGEYAF